MIARILASAAEAQNLARGPSGITLLKDKQWRIYACWALTWTAGFVTLSLWLRWAASMRQLSAKHDPLRKWFVKIVFLAEFWAIVTSLGVVFVRWYFFLNLALQLYQAVTLCCMRDAVIELAGRKEELLLQLRGKKDRYYAAFPLFFLRRWMKDIEFTEDFIRLSYWLTRQSYVAISVIAIAQLTVLLVWTQRVNFSPHGTLTALASLEVVTSFIAVYGVMLVLQPVRELVPDHRLGSKMLIIKGTVLLGVVQGFLVTFLAAVGALKRDPVLSEHTYTAAVLWTNFLLAMESPIFMYYAKQRFPLSEVVLFYDKVDAMLITVLDGNGTAQEDPDDEADIAQRDMDITQRAVLHRKASAFVKDRLSVVLASTATNVPPPPPESWCRRWSMWLLHGIPESKRESLGTTEWPSAYSWGLSAPVVTQSQPEAAAPSDGRLGVPAVAATNGGSLATVGGTGG